MLTSGDAPYTTRTCLLFLFFKWQATTWHIMQGVVECHAPQKKCFVFHSMPPRTTQGVALCLAIIVGAWHFTTTPTYL